MSAVIDASPLEQFSAVPLPTGDACLLVIFGASGDLTRRKLIPGLYNLACAGCMNPQFEVLGVGRTEMSSEEFRSRMRVSASQSSDARDFNESRWKNFERRLHYLIGDIQDDGFYSRLKARLGEHSESVPNHLFYVSTPASVAGPIVEGLKRAGLNRNAGGWVTNRFGEAFRP